MRFVKSARRSRPVGRTRFAKHGDHDQSDHGNWARGLVGQEFEAGVTPGVADFRTYTRGAKRDAVEFVLNLAYGPLGEDRPYNLIQAVARGDVVQQPITYHEGTSDEFTEEGWVNREGQPADDLGLYDWAQEQIPLIDQVFKPAEYDFVAYKGVASYRVEGLGTGDTWTDEGYSSVGLDASTGMSVMTRELFDQVGVEVLVPKGTGVIVAEQDYAYQEALLQRGMTFKVIDTYISREDFPDQGPAGWKDDGGFKEYIRVVAIPPVRKHGGDSHDQTDHGNWARGGASVDLKPTVNPPASAIEQQFQTWWNTAKAIGWPLTIAPSAIQSKADEIVHAVTENALPDLASPEWVDKVEEGVSQFAETPALQALFDRYGVPMVIPTALEGISGRSFEESGVMGQQIGGVILMPENPEHVLGDPVPTVLSNEQVVNALFGDGAIPLQVQATSMPHTLRHEYGHYVLELVANDGREASTADDATDAEQQPGLNLVARLESARLALTGTIPDVITWETEGFGAYPMTNYRELGAEAFAIVTHPEYGPEVRGQYGAGFQRVLDMVQEWTRV